MIEHIVCFKWKLGTDLVAMDKIERGLALLKGAISGIEDLTVGRNFSARGQGFQTGLVVRFSDRAALELYGDHPAHQEVVETLIKPHLESLVVVDYEI